MTTIGDSSAAVETLLRTHGLAADEAWRRWALHHVKRADLHVDELAELWRAVLDFDPVLASYVEAPVTVDGPAVLVAGSGKETFKTFNVSTAASLLAAAAGARVVKGISQSVSAVSGSADVLEELGVAVCPEPREIPSALDRDGIAFVPYAAFCPTYAARYDDVFTALTPFSFFMPTAVLAVRAQAFVHGIAHPDVLLGAAAIRAARPDLEHGVVVATALPSGHLVDEASPHGRSVVAELQRASLALKVRAGRAPTADWSDAVGHRGDHVANASLILTALDPKPRCRASQHVVELAELNAALIVRASLGLGVEQARRRVRCARQSGRALALLNQMSGQEEVRRAS